MIKYCSPKKPYECVLFNGFNFDEIEQLVPDASRNLTGHLIVPGILGPISPNFWLVKSKDLLQVLSPAEFDKKFYLYESKPIG